MHGRNGSFHLWRPHSEVAVVYFFDSALAVTSSNRKTGETLQGSESDQPFQGERAVATIPTNIIPVRFLELVPHCFSDELIFITFLSLYSELDDLLHLIARLLGVSHEFHDGVGAHGNVPRDDTRFVDQVGDWCGEDRVMQRDFPLLLQHNLKG